MPAFRKVWRSESPMFRRVWSTSSVCSPSRGGAPDIIAELSEAELERGDPGHRVFPGRGKERPHPVHLPILLSLGGERRGEEAPRQAADERAAVHHSIT